MSKIFYDHLIILEEIKVYISRVSSSQEEKEELWNLVDEIVHHRIFSMVLDKLPKEHHDNFMNKFYKAPHDERLIKFLSEKTGEDIEKIIKDESENIARELRQLVSSKNKR